MRKWNATMESQIWCQSKYFVNQEGKSSKMLIINQENLLTENKDGLITISKELISKPTFKTLYWLKKLRNQISYQMELV